MAEPKEDDKKKDPKDGATSVAAFSSGLLSRVWAILPSKLEDIIAATKMVDPMMNEKAFFSFAISQQDGDRKQYQVEDGIAILTLSGVLTKEEDLFMRIFGDGGSSSKVLIEAFNAAQNDDEVKGIFWDVDSPGGDLSATVALANAVYEARGNKPMLTFTEQMASAALWIGSGADYVVAANEATHVGSIGVYLVHSELTKAAERIGETFTIFSAGKFKASGNQFQTLSDDDKNYIQGIIEYNNSLFVDAVARNYGVSTDVVNSQMGDGKIFIGQQALDAGLVDEIANRDQAMALLKSVANGDAEFSKDNDGKQKALNSLGGENNMPTLTMEEMAAKVATLETQLAERDTAKNLLTAEVETLKSSAATEGLTAEIVDLKAAAAYMLECGTLQDAEIVSLRGSISGDAKMAEIGKQTIEAMKTDITALSVLVKGSDYNEEFVKAQIVALGTGEKAFENLSMMKAELEKSRDGMLKTGALEGGKVETDVSKMDPAAKRELGNKIGGAKVIPIN